MTHPKNSVRRTRKILLVLVVTITVITWINPRFSFLYSDNGQIKRLIQPPRLNDNDLLVLFNSTFPKKLDILAHIVQKQVLNIQHSSNCKNSYTLHCGHNDKCGIGCQIHHRASCLMMAYAMNIPLIHDEQKYWPFSNPWRDAFLPLGSNCTVDEKTIFVKWRSLNIPILYTGTWCHCFPAFCPKENQFEFPLRAGLPVSSYLDLIIKENVQNPFLWMTAQFIQLTMQLSAKQTRIVDEAMEKMQLNHIDSLVGFHVRRTDKIREAADSHHDISEYIKFAQEFFEEFGSNTQSTNRSLNPRTVFVASDDHTILKQVQIRYPPPIWRIVGMKSEHTFTEQWERRETLHEIVRDIKILSKCEYIVCGLSSNICRLLHEILAGQNEQSGQKRKQRLKSLDGIYEYLLKDFTIPNNLLAI